MFAHRYFAAHYYAPRFYPPKTGAPTPIPTPTGETSYGYFPHHEFAARYFANRYYPGSKFGVPVPTPTPTPSPSIEYLGGGGRVRHKYSYIPAWQKLKREEEKITQEIAKLETKLETKTLARPDVTASLREEINRLLVERAALIRRIDDEEAITALILTPFL
jgi:hypothetical protein